MLMHAVRPDMWHDEQSEVPMRMMTFGQQGACRNPPTWSQADLKFRAASSIAPPKRGPMVSSPLTRQDTRSLPARQVTIVLCAPAASTAIVCERSAALQPSL